MSDRIETKLPKGAVASAAACYAVEGGDPFWCVTENGYVLYDLLESEDLADEICTNLENGKGMDGWGDCGEEGDWMIDHISPHLLRHNTTTQGG